MPAACRRSLAQFRAVAAQWGPPVLETSDRGENHQAATALGAGG